MKAITGTRSSLVEAQFEIDRADKEGTAILCNYFCFYGPQMCSNYLIGKGFLNLEDFLRFSEKLSKVDDETFHRTIRGLIKRVFKDQLVE